MFYYMLDTSKIFSRQTFVHNICLCIWWTQPICCPSARWSREAGERTLASHLQPLEKMRRQLSAQSTSIVQRQREFHINQGAALCDHQWREEERGDWFGVWWLFCSADSCWKSSVRRDQQPWHQTQKESSLACSSLNAVGHGFAKHKSYIYLKTCYRLYYYSNPVPRSVQYYTIPAFILHLSICLFALHNVKLSRFIKIRWCTPTRILGRYILSTGYLWSVVQSHATTSWHKGQ